MKSGRVWWLVFFACTALVLTALGWMTSAMLRSERAELEAQEMATHQESLRLALWRMDSWLAPRVAREAARPYTDYEALTPQLTAYNDKMEPLDAGAVLTASPLVPYQSQYFRLHFQIDQQGKVSSPQAPSKSQVAVLNMNASPMSEDQWRANDEELTKLGNMVQVDELAGCVAMVEESLEQNYAPTETAASDVQTSTIVPESRTRSPERDVPMQTAAKPNAQTAQRAVDPQSGVAAQTFRNEQEWSKRAANIRQIQDESQMLQQEIVPAGDENAAVSVGPLVPLWFGGDATREGELMFVRRVRVNGNELFQGFLCDWPSLRGALLAEISDLFVEANLVPVRQFEQEDGEAAERAATNLATLPVSLRVPAPVCTAAAGFTPGRITAAIAWIVVLAGVGLTGSTLRSSIAFGQKRSQFASAVTHELRTPLTTFKMYTDMLAEGMVKDESQRQEYLHTLQGESDRLARLVENVLSYARLEDGRQTPNRRALTIGALLGRVTPPLERRASASGMTIELECTADRAAAIHSDDDAIGQILLNLVDNACKYGHAEGQDGTIHITAAQQNGSLALTVRDDGPGIPAQEARHLFRAFRRGSSSDSSQPGLGIGLTLSRALAQRLGGDLRLTQGNGGASFTLTVPLGVSAT